MQARCCVDCRCCAFCERSRALRARRGGGREDNLSLALHAGVVGSAVLVVQGFDADPNLSDDYSLDPSIGGTLLEVDWLHRELDVPFELSTESAPLPGSIEYSINYLTLQVGLVAAP